MSRGGKRRLLPPTGEPIINNGVIPVKGETKPWQGCANVKPWQREVTIAIPILDVGELLDIAVEIWSAQTAPPNIMLIDTGSGPRHIGILKELEVCAHVEIHQLRFKGLHHPSDPVAIAMDLAFSACRTKYLFATHADCFPMRRDLIETFIDWSKSHSIPVVGYQITDRPKIPVEGWVGHTATLFDMEELDQHNLCWSQRKYCRATGMSHEGDGKTSGHPDTEFMINHQLDELGIKRAIMGTEENFKTTLDENIHHVRSYGSSKLYCEKHFDKAEKDMAIAVRDARERIKKWENEDNEKADR